MYCFVEPWITELLHIPNDPFGIANGSFVNIIDIENTARLRDSFLQIHEEDNDSSLIRPVIIDTTVRGMKTILMRYWVDETLLFSITDGPVKDTDQFRYFMGLANPRFNFELIKERLRHRFDPGNTRVITVDTIVTNTGSAAASTIGNGVGATIAGSAIGVDGATIMGIDTGVVPAEPEQFPVLTTAQFEEHLNIVFPRSQGLINEILNDPLLNEPVAKNEARPNNIIDKIIEDVIPKMKSETEKGVEFIKELHRSFYMTSAKLYPIDNTDLSIIYDDMTIDFVRDLSDLAVKLNKNIVATRYFQNNSVKSFLKSKNLNDIYKHTLVLNITPEVSNNDEKFVKQDASNKSRNEYGYTICLGEEVKAHFIIRSSDVNEKIKNIRGSYGLTDSEKEKKIKELIDNRENSPFFKYDCIFKDTNTNIIWGLRNRCVITLMFNMYEEKNQLFRKCLKEIARRINMNIPYEELLKIDTEYFKDLSSNNLDSYIKFSLASSRTVYESIENLYNEQVSLFKKYMDMAMEASKLMQRYKDQMGAFDMEKFERNEREKAKNNYQDTIGIHKVSSIFVREGTIHVYTKNIYTKDERSNKWHDIGTFHITIGMLDTAYSTNNTVRIFNTKFTGMGMNNGFHAPHVFEDGHACHGNLVTGMVEAYKQRNLFDLVYQIILFLQSANTADGAGQYVNTWPEVSEEVALKSEYENMHIYEEKVEIEKKFDDMLASAIPIRITT